MVNELVLGGKYFIYVDSENFKCLKKKERRLRIEKVTLERTTSIGNDRCLYTFKSKKKIFDEAHSKKGNQLVLCDNDPHILTNAEIKKLRKPDELDKMCSERKLKKNNYKKAHKKHCKKK